MRSLLTLLIWRPLVWLARLVAAAARAIWAFLGRCGLALRKILTVILWRPLLFITRPFRWLFRRLLLPPVAFVWASLREFGQWLLVETTFPPLQAAVRFSMTTFDEARRLTKRIITGRSDDFEDRLDDIRPRRARPGEEAYIPPRGAYSRSRLSRRRLSIALVAAGVVIVLAVAANQARQPDSLFAIGLAPPTPTLAPTATPTATATATATSTATPTLTPTPLPTATPQPPPRAVLQAPWPTPDPLSKGGSVAFTLRQDGNVDIYVLTVGASEPIRLTSHPAEDRDPAWSPDGRLLAFASDRDGNWEIYVLDLASGEIERVTEDPAFDGGPSWSPDGKWLVYESYRAGNLDLYIVDVDGGEPIRLTEHPSEDFAPTWAPGGRHIAFTSWRNGNKDIYLMSLDIPSDEEAPNVTNSPDLNEDHASFEPDGRFLAYEDDSAGLDLIYVRPLVGYQAAGAPISIGQGNHPSWSPDGSSLVYAHNSEKQNYLIASSVDSWSVAPQVFATEARIGDLAWSGMILPRDVEDVLAGDDSTEETANFVEQLTPAEGDGPPYLIWELDVDAPSPYLSDRVDQSFTALRQRVITEAGWDFLARLDNLFASLVASPLPGESNRSWNKAGRAFDFYYRYPISLDPQVEVVREDQGTQTFWRVFLKTAQQDGSQGEPLRELPWDFAARYESDPQYYDQGGKLKDTIPAGYYVDFTALAADYGWTRVPALDNWRTFFQGIRYWHFENRQGLTWEEAILELYSSNELARAFGNQ